MPLKKSSSGRGQSRSNPPDPLKTAHMVSDAIEMAPSLAIPLQVQTGAHGWQTNLLPHNDLIGLIDVLNTEDGHEYQILVVRKIPASRSLTTARKESNETTEKA